MEDIKHIHFRVRHWVVWWFYIGIACGLVAVVNVLFRDLTRAQDHVILIAGIAFWALGGFVCWASDSVHWQEPPRPVHPHDEAQPVLLLVSDSTAGVLNRQWQRHDIRDAASHFHVRHP